MALASLNVQVGITEKALLQIINEIGCSILCLQELSFTRGSHSIGPLHTLFVAACTAARSLES